MSRASTTSSELYSVLRAANEIPEHGTTTPDAWPPCVRQTPPARDRSEGAVVDRRRRWGWTRMVFRLDEILFLQPVRLNMQASQ
jgi:hypothetical protein